MRYRNEQTGAIATRGSYCCNQGYFVHYPLLLPYILHQILFHHKETQQWLPWEPIPYAYICMTRTPQALLFNVPAACVLVSVSACKGL